MKTNNPALPAVLPASTAHPELWATLAPICAALNWPVEQVCLVAMDSRPMDKGGKRKLLRNWDRAGLFILSQSPQVKQWLIGAGWWHRGIAEPTLDIYWKPGLLTVRQGDRDGACINQ